MLAPTPRLLCVVAALLLSGLLGACDPPPQPRSETGKTFAGASAGSGEATGEEASPVERNYLASQQALQAARSKSLIDPRQQCGGVPVAWSLTGDGTALLGLVSKSDPLRNEIYRWPLGPGQSGVELLARATLGFRAFVASRPGTAQALASTLQPQPDGRLADEYWLVEAGSEPKRLDYLNAEGLPDDLAPDALEGRASFFSLEGRYLVVPVGLRGVVVLDLASGQRRYAALPDFGEIPVQGVRCNILASQQGEEYIYASQFALGSGVTQAPDGTLIPDPADYCQVSLLNLATMQWTRTRRFDWIVIEVGCQDIAGQPLALLGSRAKTLATEHPRMAKLTSLDPATGVELVKPYAEGLGWDAFEGMQLTPDGRYFVYKDYERAAVVRIDLSSGESLDDSTNYLNDGGLLLDNAAQTVLLVQQDVAVRCELRPVPAE